MRLIGLLVLIFFMHSCVNKKNIFSVDASSRLIQIIKNKQSKGGGTILIEPGDYYIDQPIWDGILNNDISIKGKGKVNFYCSHKVANFKAPSEKRKLNIPPLRGQTKISGDFSGLTIKPNLCLIIANDQIVEKSWKYDKGELHEIKKLSNNQIVFKDEVLFNYQKTEKLKVLLIESRNIHLENINFIIDQNSPIKQNVLLNLKGCSLKLNNVNYDNKRTEKKSWFASINQGINIDINNVKIDNAKYGFVLNYSKNATFKNIVSNNTTHPVVPSTFTQNVLVDSLSGVSTSLDAHPSFNVKYSNVEITNGGFNCRAFGVEFENCVFKSPRAASGKTYLGVSSLTDESKSLAYEYDVIMNNVQYVKQIGSFNGLHVDRVRKFKLNNVKTHMISTGSFVKEIEITNSHIGRFQNYQTSCTVLNTVFDASLQGNKDPKPPLSFSYSGEAKVEDCIFKGFDKSFLIDYVHSPKSEISFVNCEFDSLEGLVKKFGNKEKQYRGLKFEKSEFKKVKNISKQIPIQRNFLNNKKKN